MGGKDERGENAQKSKDGESCVPVAIIAVFPPKGGILLSDSGEKEK